MLKDGESKYDHQEKRTKLLSLKILLSKTLPIGDGFAHSNLLENSARYTDRGGRVRIATHREGSRVVVDFDDSAPGVPAGSLAHLFERFYRVDASRSRANGGAGLGLAICRSIASAHDGTISAADSPLGGLRVRVSLPVAA